MVSIFVKVIYFLVVSVVSGCFYYGRLVDGNGRYIRRKGILMCVCIFVSHLLVLMPFAQNEKATYILLQILIEYMLMTAFLTGEKDEDLVRSLIVYVEWNVILGISMVCGYGLLLVNGWDNEILFYFMAMSLASIIGGLFNAFTDKKWKKTGLAGRELIISLSMALLCIMYVIAMAMYEIKSMHTIVVLYIVFAILLMLVFFVFYINKSIYEKEELEMKHYVYSMIERNMEQLEGRMAKEERYYVDSYNWFVENMEEIYEEMLKLAEDVGSDTRALAIKEMMDRKKLLATELGIEIHCENVECVPKNILVYDIISIYSNLIDNAMRAVRSVNDKYIEVITKMDGDKFCLRVSNMILSGAEITFDSNGNVQTSKEDKVNHGLGLKSVRSIVNKYGLHMDVRVLNGEFEVLIRQ